MSMYTRETINELNTLSKAVFGSTSKWRKMVENGVVELLEEDTKKLDIVDGKEIYETVKTPKMHVGPNGGELQQYQLHRYTAEEAKDFMLKVLVKREEIRQLIENAKKQKEAEEVAKETAIEASGTAI